MGDAENDVCLEAIRRNATAELDGILMAGRSVAERFHFQSTLLHYAARAGATDCARVLLKHGAELEAVDEQGHTALIEAISFQQAETAAFLLGAGARSTYRHVPEDSPESRNRSAKQFQAVLDQAFASEAQVFDELHQLDVEVNVAEITAAAVKAMVSPRDILAIHHCSDLATLKLLVQHYQSPVNTHDGGGYWPLKSFAESGDVDAVAWLLLNGADPNFTSTGDTALHAAVAGNHLECARLLLNSGGNPNQQDVDGFVPLGRVTSSAMLDLLLSYGADPNIGDQCCFKPSRWVKDPDLKARLQALEK